MPFCATFTTVYVLYSLDTTNKAYKKANDLMNEVSPILSNYGNEINKILFKAPYRKDLEAKFGKHFFTMIDFSLKGFDEKIIINDNPKIPQFKNDKLRMWESPIYPICKDMKAKIDDMALKMKILGEENKKKNDNSENIAIEQNNSSSLNNNEKENSEINCIQDVRRGVISIEFSGNIGVIKTRAGHAQSVCAALDVLQLPEILGTLAGDDTIFLLLREGMTKEDLLEDFRTRIPEID